MTEKLLDQAEALFQPLAEMVSLNQAAIETLAGKQTDLLMGLWTDGLAFTQKILGEKQGNFIELQTAYWESVSQRVTEATQSSVDVFTVTQEKIANLFQASPVAKSYSQVVKPLVSTAIVSEPQAPKTVKIAAEPLTAAVAKVKIPAEPAKPKLPVKATGKKVGGDKASVEKAIHSIMSERN